MKVVTIIISSINSPWYIYWRPPLNFSQKNNNLFKIQEKQTPKSKIKQKRIRKKKEREFDHPFQRHLLTMPAGINLSGVASFWCSFDATLYYSADTRQCRLSQVFVSFFILFALSRCGADDLKSRAVNNGKVRYCIQMYKLGEYKLKPFWLTQVL